MQALSYRGYRFPAAVIHHAVWLSLRFTLGLRDVEELLAERGIIVSYETIRRWVTHFGPMYARRLRAMRPTPTGRWHLDEMFVSIAGGLMYLWRAVDDEGEVLDFLVQARRDKHAAQRLMRKLLKRQGSLPTSLITDRYRAYDAAFRDLGLSHLHHRGSDSTTELRVRTCRSDDESGRCRVFDLLDRRNAFSPVTLPFTTHSTSAAI